MKSKRHRSPRPGTMKCVVLVNGEVIRVRYERAHELVLAKAAKYCPKQEWRRKR